MDKQIVLVPGNNTSYKETMLMGETLKDYFEPFLTGVKDRVLYINQVASALNYPKFADSGEILVIFDSSFEQSSQRVFGISPKSSKDEDIIKGLSKAGFQCKLEIYAQHGIPFVFLPMSNLCRSTREFSRYFDYGIKEKMLACWKDNLSRYVHSGLSSPYLL